MTTSATSTSSGPPRPDVWEVPDLRRGGNFLQRPSRLRDDISDRLLYALQNQRINQDPQSQFLVERFLRTIITFGHDVEWEPHRLLGKGGWGMVGLWVNKDIDGNTVDELAVKNQPDNLKVPPEHMYYTEPGTAPMLGRIREAVINLQMNEYSSENILHLRGYRWITQQDPQRGIRAGPGVDAFRLYYEFAPYQNLQDLIDRYQAWNQLLPEAFLWHIFDSLAAALEILRQGPRQTFSSQISSWGVARHWPTSTEVVHFDIKPSNVFLSYEDFHQESLATGGSRVLGYPIVKLSDYGLAQITWPSDPSNPSELFWRGTPYYKPSEQVAYGAEFDAPPNGRRRNNIRDALGQLPTVDEIKTSIRQDRNPGYSFTNAANVWSLGKVMYDLTVLSRAMQLDMNHIQSQNPETNYILNGHHFINEHAWNTIPFMSTQAQQPPQTPYSSELMDLIRDCLRPSIRRRVGVRTLRMRTQRGLARAEHSLDPANASQPVPNLPLVSKLCRTPGMQIPKVYYRDNEINNMPLGRAVFPMAHWDYDRLVNNPYMDPDWEPLRLPARKWATAQRNAPTRPPPPPTSRYRISRGRIHFRQSRARRAARQPQGQAQQSATGQQP